MRFSIALLVSALLLGGCATPATDARLTIGTDGKIEECDTLDTLGERQVDSFVCDQLTAKAHYRAAHDRDGKAVRGVAIVPLDMSIKSTLTKD